MEAIRRALRGLSPCLAILLGLSAAPLAHAVPIHEESGSYHRHFLLTEDESLAQFALDITWGSGWKDGMLGEGWGILPERSLGIAPDGYALVESPCPTERVRFAPKNPSREKTGAPSAWNPGATSCGLMTLRRDGEGYRATPIERMNGWAFDEKGRFAGAVSDGQVVVKVERSDDGRIAAMSDGKRRLTFRYDDAGKVTGINGPDGRKASFRYDDAGRLIYARTFEGTDGIERRSERIRGGRFLEYDALGRVSAETVGNGRRRFLYDAESRVIRVEASRTDDDSHSFTEYERDPGSGRPTRVSVHKSGMEEGEAETTRFRYDEKGRVIEAVATDNTRYEVSYDAGGRIARMAGNGLVYHYRYDERHGKPSAFEEEGVGRIAVTYEEDGKIREVKVEIASGRWMEQRAFALRVAEFHAKYEKLIGLAVVDVPN